jgi:hypothetical protein
LDEYKKFVSHDSLRDDLQISQSDFLSNKYL